jgi:hypothetical protein
VDGIKDVKKIVCGENHVIALDIKGKVWTWGMSEQNQLGRRVLQRNRTGPLTPYRVGIASNIQSIGSGQHHSFAVDGRDNVWAVRYLLMALSRVHMLTMVSGDSITLVKQVMLDLLEVILICFPIP